MPRVDGERRDFCTAMVTFTVAAPVAFGVLDKVIALPPLFMAQPDIVARDLAIEHEVAHHRGNDLLANFAAQALLGKVSKPFPRPIMTR